MLCFRDDDIVHGTLTNTKQLYLASLNKIEVEKVKKR